MVEILSQSFLAGSQICIVYCLQPQSCMRAAVYKHNFRPPCNIPIERSRSSPRGRERAEQQQLEMARLQPEPESVLPKFVVLRSRQNGKYLRYVPESGGRLEFSGDDLWSPFSKLETEFQSEKVEEGYFNLRCSYNNKYWRRRRKAGGGDDNIISGDGAEAQPNTSKWSCTLFKQFLSAREHTVRLWHVQLGRYLSSVPSGDHLELAAESEKPKQDGSDVFEYVDWESLVQLPKNVAFKGSNGKYLRASSQRLTYDHWYLPHALNPAYPFLKFEGDDLAEEAVGHEVVPNPDGTIRIRSHHFNKFWRTHADNGYGLTRWIWADMGDHADMYTSYRVVKLEDNIIALRTCAPDGHFCKMLTNDNIHDCLSPMADLGPGSQPTIEKSAHLTVEEPVVSRRIYDVNFRQQDARVYNQVPLTMESQTVPNPSPDPVTTKVSLKWEDTTTTTWKTSSSWSESTEFAVNLTVTKIPFFDGANIAYKSEESGTQEWTTTKEVKRGGGVEPEVRVPAMSSVVVKVCPIQATCDVPFSFMCRDIAPCGIVNTYGRDDGIVTVSSTFTTIEISEPVPLRN